MFIDLNTEQKPYIEQYPPTPSKKQTKKQKEKKHAKYKHQRLQLFSVPFICCHYETFFRTDYSSFHEKWKKKELMWFFCKTSVFCVRHYTYLFVCFGTFYRLGHKNLGHYHLCNWTNLHNFKYKDYKDLYLVVNPLFTLMNTCQDCRLTSSRVL